MQVRPARVKSTPLGRRLHSPKKTDQKDRTLLSGTRNEQLSVPVPAKKNDAESVLSSGTTVQVFVSPRKSDHCGTRIR